MKASDFVDLVTFVTKEWTKQRKAEERNSRARNRRDSMYSRPLRHTEVAAEILPPAYSKVSDNGHYSASQRQVFYACRDLFLQRTGRELEWPYFSQDLLRKFLNRPETETWKVSRDARGKLTEPHTRRRIPVGTLEIDSYLEESRSNPARNPSFEFAQSYPTCGPRNRYQAVLYIEKEGFNPLFEQVQLAERYDIAIISCKGQSVIAARKLADEFCHESGIPLLVLHDFDKYGFSICQNLSGVSCAAEEAGRVAYRFKNKVNVIDLGLRLTDIQEWSLKPEPCRFRGGFDSRCQITSAEKAFLRSGHRVELNEFTSGDFIQFVESKLRAAGLVEKLIPDAPALDDAYRYALRVAHLTRVIRAAETEADELAVAATVPAKLRASIRKALKANPSMSWDAALFQIVMQEAGR